MRNGLAVISLALLTGCVAAGPSTKSAADLPNRQTLDLCKIALTDSDEAYRVAAAKLAVRRGASLEKCQRLIATDGAIVTGIAIAGTAAAVGAAGSGGYGSGYGYGYAWDRFPDGQWRCRSKANGQFVPDEYCGGPPVYDAWP